MPDEYPTCVNCGGRIQKINFALGPEWRHWPTPHGNYRTNELYRYCRTAALVATPKPADPVRCPKCGGPDPFHDPACVVHPDLIQDHTNGSER